MIVKVVVEIERMEVYTNKLKEVKRDEDEHLLRSFLMCKIKHRFDVYVIIPIHCYNSKEVLLFSHFGICSTNYEVRIETFILKTLSIAEQDMMHTYVNTHTDKLNSYVLCFYQIEILSTLSQEYHFYSLDLSKHVHTQNEKDELIFISFMIHTINLYSRFA